MSPRPLRLLRAWVPALAALLLAAASVFAATLAPSTLERARLVRDRALADDTAYECLRSLTTEVGPRMAGSPGDARAVAWAQATMKALGLRNVRTEPALVPHWIRGEARVEIVAPWPQPLTACALGGSVGTPPGGIQAEVVGMSSLDELKKATRERVEGRIVYIGGRMERTHDGAGYQSAVEKRGAAPREGAKLGAVAVLIRSAGTSKGRTPHTGATRYDAGGPRIPALALANPDADVLERELASGRPVRVRVTSSSVWADSTMSASVIGEIPGRRLAREIVLLGAHLDSWDLGTGAHDDGTGVATVLAAARLVGRMKPARTIRVVLFANEEFGTSGSKAYVRNHHAELDRHVLAMESDLGAFRPIGFSSVVPLERLALAHEVHAALESMGLAWAGNEAHAGSDVDTLRALGVPVMAIETDAEPYFDLHHTANDTFDQVDPDLLRRNVAAYAMVALIAAEVEGGFGRVPVVQAARP